MAGGAIEGLSLGAIASRLLSRAFAAELRSSRHHSYPLPASRERPALSDRAIGGVLHNIENDREGADRISPRSGRVAHREKTEPVAVILGARAGLVPQVRGSSSRRICMKLSLDEEDLSMHAPAVEIPSGNITA